MATPDILALDTLTAPEFGRAWFTALNTAVTPGHGALLTGETDLNGTTAALAAIVPDPDNAFPRVRQGEVGLKESLDLAAWVNGLDDPQQPIVLIIDVPSQAYGYVEELFGINYALATSVNALAQARLNGHPVISFIVGNAISGAFLATGLQSNRIVALSHEGVQVQVMSKKAAARITQRTVEELDKAAESIPAVAFDGASFTTLGAVSEVITPQNPEAPAEEDLEAARKTLVGALDDIRSDSDRSLRSRLESKEAHDSRALSLKVREVVNAQW